MKLSEQLQELLKPYENKYVKASDLDMDIRDINVAFMDEPSIIEETYMHGVRYIRCTVPVEPKKKAKKKKTNEEG